MDLELLQHMAALGATDIHPLGDEATDILFSKLALEGHERVLDYGCGTGATLVRVGLRYPDVGLFGIDALPAMLRVARRRVWVTGLRARTRLASCNTGEPLPFADRSFDRVWTESVLGFQDARTAREMLSEIARLLAPNGMYVANEAVWKSGVSKETAAAINRACIRDFGVRQASAEPWSHDDWIGLMREVGFEVISSDRLSADSSAEVCEKSPRTARWLLSNLLSKAHRAAALADPRVALRAWRFREAFLRHTEDGEHIEGRLFVLRRRTS